MAIRFDQIELAASNHTDYPVLSHGGNGLQITTSTGTGNLGSGNSSYFHISTDRGTFYFSLQSGQSVFVVVVAAAVFGRGAVPASAGWRRARPNWHRLVRC